MISSKTFRDTKGLALCSCLLFFFSFFYFSLPLTAGAEFIETFTADIAVHDDATFSVKETIEYNFDEPRHGIFREIPLIHQEPPSKFFKERFIALTLMGVEMDGEAVPYVDESTDDLFVVRIGDPDSTITGTHRYDISYTVRGGLSYPSGEGTELYWNTTGNGWDVPIRFARTFLSDPDNVFRTARSCYAGVLGSTSSSCHQEQGEEGRVSFTVPDLNPHEGMTIAQSLDHTRVPKVVLERTKMVWFVLPLTLLCLIYGFFRLYRYKTEHKTGKTIIPEYEPYPNMKPMYTGLLIDGRLDPKDITAAIVHLAASGYLKIKKMERKVLFLFEVDDYEITLLKLPDDVLGKFERSVFTLIFSEPLQVGSTVSLAELKSNQGERRENYQEFLALQREMSSDLREKGFREIMDKGSIARVLGIVLIAWGIFYVAAVWNINSGYFISGLFIALFLGVFLYERKTQLAYEVTDYLQGFKLFLETTERDRYLFHNAPEKSPEQFMEYLPYAIAFGVEEKWAEVFKDITIPVPGWYDGGSVSTFNAASLSHSLGAFSTAFASSSGASASSGGGSSGGGSGGGGGGSW